MLDGARHVHEALVCADCQARYLLEVFAQLAAHLGLARTFDDRAALSATLRRSVNCSTFVELLPSPDGRVATRALRDGCDPLTTPPLVDPHPHHHHTYAPDP